eukprot:TRINITY_DN8460_c0_g1_i1.p1 TRINITY_DN8460_c0_g1~~TRINITY_DN8460_c0_g1_i1.p1  ORF type:complete len:984 (-),score=268.14 TRINITY_DN8460_c0_g1_i1:31-2982(-)
MGSSSVCCAQAEEGDELFFAPSLVSASVLPGSDEIQRSRQEHAAKRQEEADRRRKEQAEEKERLLEAEHQQREAEAAKRRREQEEECARLAAEEAERQTRQAEAEAAKERARLAAEEAECQRRDAEAAKRRREEEEERARVMAKEVERQRRGAEAAKRRREEEEERARLAAEQAERHRHEAEASKRRREEEEERLRLVAEAAERQQRKHEIEASKRRREEEEERLRLVAEEAERLQRSREVEAAKQRREEEQERARLEAEEAERQQRRREVEAEAAKRHRVEEEKEQMRRVAQKAECQQLEGAHCIDGCWVGASRAEIRNGKVLCETGVSSDIEVDVQGNATMIVDGERIYGNFRDDGKLYWEDGDVWTREQHCRQQLDGCWVGAERAEIRSGKVMWETGISSDIEFGDQGNVSMILDGKQFYGKLGDDGKLYWEDGDIWTRRQSSQEQQHTSSSTCQLHKHNSTDTNKPSSTGTNPEQLLHHSTLHQNSTAATHHQHQDEQRPNAAYPNSTVTAHQQVVPMQAFAAGQEATHPEEMPERKAADPEWTAAECRQAPEWSCPTCTFLNEAGTPDCRLCGGPAPELASSSKSEEQKGSKEALLSLDGHWSGAEIRGGKVIWENGSSHDIEMVDSRHVRLLLGDELFHGELRDDGKLYWEDGDVWTKEQEAAVELGAGEAKHPTSSGWECATCTFVNSQASKSCSVCGASCPELPLESSASDTLTSSAPHDFRGHTDRGRPDAPQPANEDVAVAAQSDASDATPSEGGLCRREAGHDEEEWVCQSCTFQNGRGTAECGICGSARQLQLPLPPSDVDAGIAGAGRDLDAADGGSTGTPGVIDVPPIVPLQTAEVSFAEDGDGCKKHSELAPLAIGGSLSSSAEWTCPACTVLNEQGAAKCKLCAATRQELRLPGAAASSSSPLRSLRAGGASPRFGQDSHRDSARTLLGLWETRPESERTLTGLWTDRSGTDRSDVSDCMIGKISSV